jgi:hypothetical protein
MRHDLERAKSMLQDSNLKRLTNNRVRYFEITIFGMWCSVDRFSPSERIQCFFFKVLTTLLTELNPSWGAANCAVTQELPAFYRTTRLITVFTRRLHWSLSWAISIQSTPFHHISLRSILILYPQWSLTFWLSHQYTICSPLLPPFVLRAPPITFFWTWSF